ncbi:hypothetical protein [Streptomyces chilikensis]|uniref:Uncharacterized protein n=1 Tax=Streptomyces chilikensis TaxID=1194079 RepID=A0ABV3ERI1_9ACTN
MYNNRIYITGNPHMVDASLLADSEWAQLVAANRNSTRRRLVKCAWCWENDQVTHWMKTYTRPNGTRVVSHQPGEATDHPYQAVESEEHKAYCDRVARVGQAEGYTARREATAADGRTRSDVLLIGSRHISYEMQHSPFKTGYGATERTRRALAAKRDAVAWHTDSDTIARAAKVTMLRSNVARRPQIENPRYEVRILGGFRQAVVWKCTARDAYRCPDGRFTGCGKTHFDTKPGGITLDDFIRQAPAGLVLPVKPLSRTGYWLTAADYRVWLEHSGHIDQLDALDITVPKVKPTHHGEGHSRTSAAEDHGLFPLTAVPQQHTHTPPVLATPRARVCDAGVTPCGQPGRLYACGWRCEAHRP